MALTSKLSIVLLSIAVASGNAKDKPKFTPGPVTSYPCRQTIEKVTVAAVPFITEAETETAFGKLNPNKYGVLPVLVVIQNDGDQALALSNLEVQFIDADRDKVDATPAKDVRYVNSPDRPKVYTVPIPGAPPHVSRKKNPLNAWEIEGRAFAAQMLPPKQSASGFFYFRVPYRGGSTFYLRGIREAATGRELFYFEIPLDKK